jgi:hypothetical protein
MSEKTDVMITPQRRRPTGAPPPLPHPVSATTRAWLVLAVVVLAAQPAAHHIPADPRLPIQPGPPGHVHDDASP